MTPRRDAQPTADVEDGPLRLVADLGNSRIKLAWVDPEGVLGRPVALDPNRPADWDSFLQGRPSQGQVIAAALSSVNPPLAAHVADWLATSKVPDLRWYRSAADVPLRSSLRSPETSGADRALAALAAVSLKPVDRPALVVSCGTALTVDRVTADGHWQGGAIAPGLGPAGRALSLSTAQLPLITPGDAPPPWGVDTASALSAGLFWGAVGTLRELLERQSDGLDRPPWVVLTGGDAERFAPWLQRPVDVIPDLVLRGLVRAAFPPLHREQGP